MKEPNRWPSLSQSNWQDTYATLHMWTQVVGKIALALTPRTNHFWNIAMQVTPRGLATPSLTYGGLAFVMTFDFVAHQLLIQASDGRTESIPLQPRSVADFYHLVMETLRKMGIKVRIWTMPVEVLNPIRFEADVMHHSYDPQSANELWQILATIKPVFETFRAEFIGKASPVHFFWGGFDLAATRFSGRLAPERPGADAVTRESYSHEVISHGFWPGSGALKEPAFYAYAAPEPAGFKEDSVQPGAAFYSTDFSEFILPYEAVRTAASPADDLKNFLTTTYDRAANRANWNRAELERRH